MPTSSPPSNRNSVFTKKSRAGTYTPLQHDCSSCLIVKFCML